jgi:hypothetical protein
MDYLTVTEYRLTAKNCGVLQWDGNDTPLKLPVTWVDWGCSILFHNNQRPEAHDGFR